MTLMISKTTIREIGPMLDRVRQIVELDPVGRINKASGKTKTNGSQHSIDIHDPLFRPLLDVICSIPTGRFDIIDVWTNINYPNGSNIKHFHNGADIAGCFYLHVPENSGEIEFESGDKFLPNAGDVYWWNANLPHWVHENKSTENRIAVAFNIRIVKDNYER
jgi:hypothetical protein